NFPRQNQTRKRMCLRVFYSLQIAFQILQKQLEDFLRDALARAEHQLASHRIEWIDVHDDFASIAVGLNDTGHLRSVTEDFAEKRLVEFHFELKFLRLG